MAQYGQERDTARLNVTLSDEQVIRMTLSDDMDDALFDFPLTVKLRLPSAWTACCTVQAGQEIPTRIVDHEGAKFALVQPIPDRGEVILRRLAGTSAAERGARQ
ncbi:MAG: hypothetical protein JJ992_13035 [Planctomycetes bacterium]|nr:hypothetical protein [Planctomycetota bacterium]